jgi:hypothetical protein
LAKNSKAKIRRTLKNYGIDLSGEINVPDLESFQTRKEFNEWKEKQSSFTNRNNLTYQFVKNEFGVVANKKTINEIQRETKQAQRLAKQKIKEVERLSNTERGEMLAQRRFLSGKEQNVTGISIPKDFNFGKIRSVRQLREKRENVKKKTQDVFYDERNQTMKDNYIEMLKKSFNSDADLVIKEIESMNADDFYALYLLEINDLDFDLFYPVDGVDDGRDLDDLNKLQSIVDEYYQGGYDQDLLLKNFPNR